MKSTLLFNALLAASMTANAETRGFDGDAVGQPPAGWTCGATGRGSPRWTVEMDPGSTSQSKVLKQGGSGTFPWCVKNDTALTDGMVEVRFKPISGKEDQAGGVVWRWKNGDNYYVARANALENNVALYYTIDGSRHTIASKDAPVATNTWHTLRVSYKGEVMEVALDGKTYITEKDRHITGGGKTGVWTKADSVTIFEGFDFHQ